MRNKSQHSLGPCASSCGAIFLAWRHLIIMVALAFSSCPAMADMADNGGSFLAAGVDNGKVGVSVSIAGALTPETMKALSSGTPVTFTYVIQVNKERFLFWDRTAKQVVVKRVVKYDALKKQYLAWEKRDDEKSEDEIDFLAELKDVEYKNTDVKTVNGPSTPTAPTTGGNDTPAVLEPLILPTTREMEEWVNTTGKVDLGTAQSLGAPGDYYAQARLKVKSMNPSPPMTYILFFISYLDLDTGWLQSGSFHVAHEPGPTPPGRRQSVQ